MHVWLQFIRFFRSLTLYGSSPVSFRGRGFTLLEVIIVTVVLIILSTFSAMFFSRFLVQNSVDSVKDQLYSALRKAQVYSSTSRKSAISGWGVHNDTVARRITLFQGATYAARTTALDESFVYSSSITVNGFTDILFARVTGKPAPSGTTTITVRGNNGTTRQVSVNGEGTIGILPTGAPTAVPTLSPTPTSVVPTNTPLPPTNTPVPPTVTPTPPAWPYRKQITILDPQVSGTTNHVNFPVLINLVSDADLAARAQDDGDDIKFTLSDGTTKLDHEIESFNGTTGALIAWVRIPSLNVVANTVIYVYYGNSTATNQQNVTGTWNSNYVGVWHLKESSGVHRDSTVNNFSSSLINVTQQGANIGQIDGADSFNGIDDWVEFPDNPAYTSMSDLTVEAWAKTDVLPNTKGESEVIVGKVSSVSPFWSYALYFDKEFGGNKMSFIWFNTLGESAYSVSAINSITTGTWYHLVGVKNGTSMQIYVNASTSGTTNLAASGTLADSDLPLRFGTEWDCASLGCNLLDGTVDEVRISNVARSSDWVLTEYNNQSSPATFYTLGAQQTL